MEKGKGATGWTGFLISDGNSEGGKKDVGWLAKGKEKEAPATTRRLLPRTTERYKCPAICAGGKRRGGRR